MASVASATSNSSSEGKRRRRRPASPPAMYLWEPDAPAPKPPRPLIKIEKSPAKVKEKNSKPKTKEEKEREKKERKRELAERFAADRKGKTPSADTSPPQAAASSSLSATTPSATFSSESTRSSPVTSPARSLGRKTKSLSVGPLFSLGGLRRLSSASATTSSHVDGHKEEQRGKAKDEERMWQEHLRLHEQRAAGTSTPTPAQVYAQTHAQSQFHAEHDAQPPPLPPKEYPPPQSYPQAYYPIHPHYPTYLPPLPEVSTPTESSYHSDGALDVPSPTASFTSSRYQYSDRDADSVLTETDSEAFVHAALDRAPSVLFLQITPSAENEQDSNPAVPLPRRPRSETFGSTRTGGASLEIVEVERRPESVVSIPAMDFAPSTPTPLTPPPTPPGGQPRHVTLSNASAASAGSARSAASAGTGDSGRAGGLMRPVNPAFMHSNDSSHSIHSAESHASASTASSEIHEIEERMRAEQEDRIEQMRWEMRQEEIEEEERSRDEYATPSPLYSTPTPTDVSRDTIFEEDEDAASVDYSVNDENEEDSDTETETESILEQDSTLLAGRARIGSALRTQLTTPRPVVAFSTATLRMLPPVSPPPSSSTSSSPLSARSTPVFIPPHVLEPPPLEPSTGSLSRSSSLGRSSAAPRGPRGPLPPIPVARPKTSEGRTRGGVSLSSYSNPSENGRPKTSDGRAGAPLGVFTLPQHAKGSGGRQSMESEPATATELSFTFHTTATRTNLDMDASSVMSGGDADPLSHLPASQSPTLLSNDRRTAHESRVLGEYQPDGDFVHVPYRVSLEEDELVGGPRERFAEGVGARREVKVWTGEWNQPDIGDVISKLRYLR